MAALNNQMTVGYAVAIHNPAQSTTAKITDNSGKVLFDGTIKVGTYYAVDTSGASTPIKIDNPLFAPAIELNATNCTVTIWDGSPEGAGPTPVILYPAD